MTKGSNLHLNEDGKIKQPEEQSTFHKYELVNSIENLNLSFPELNVYFLNVM